MKTIDENLNYNKNLEIHENQMKNEFNHFPIQNLLKILSSKSSVVMLPVISPRW